MSAALRQRAQPPAGSKYFIALSDLSGAIYELSDSRFLPHPLLSTGTSTTSGTVMLDMGKSFTQAQISSISTGTVYHKVKFVGTRFAPLFSAPDAYVETVNTNGNTTGSPGAGFGRIARLG